MNTQAVVRYFKTIARFIMKLSILIVCNIILLTIHIKAQDKYTNEECKQRTGFEYGAVAGIYIANNTSADFYSGRPDKENYVNYVFNNAHWYEELWKMDFFKDTAYVLGYPEKMSYAPAFSFGLFVKYDFSCRTGIYAQFYYAKLRANDIVTVEVDPPIEALYERKIRHCAITGIEERNILDIGISHSVGLNRVSRLSLGAGLSMNNTLVKEHFIFIAEKKYNLMRIYGNNLYVPNSNQQIFQVRQGGIGFGMFASVGVRFEFSPVVAVEPGASVHFMKINLDEVTSLTPQMNFFLKLSFRDLLRFN
jgi:hypothetical protein